MSERPLPAAPPRMLVRRPRIAPGSLSRWAASAGPVLALLVVLLAFAVLTGAPTRYLSPLNLRVVLSQTVIVAMGAIGMTIIMISGGIDLSVGATIALTGVATALGIANGWPPVAALGAAILLGGVVGFVNGALITGLRV